MVKRVRKRPLTPEESEALDQRIIAELDGIFPREAPEDPDVTRLLADLEAKPRTTPTLAARIRARRKRSTEP